VQFPFPKLLFVVCKVVGFSLLFISWIESGEATGFFPFIVIGIFTVIRLRLPNMWLTIIIDGILLLFVGEYFALSIFVISELFYRAWAGERKRGLKMRDAQAGKYYELEQLQGDLLTATAQVERMTALSERARIAREIHDNAGHEIVGAYISLQTARELMPGTEHEILELYDTALERLEAGVTRIREAVHNLAPVTSFGVEALRETCDRFPLCKVRLNTFGNLSAVPMYCWNLLEACLNEALTNIMRHAEAKQVTVELDATPTIIRLSIENDGAKHKVKAAGMGLRNLRYRASAVGGNISVDAGEIFRVICVIPLITYGGKNEVNNCR
jgi:signal transduction histidine kinase